MARSFAKLRIRRSQLQATRSVQATSSGKPARLSCALVKYQPRDEAKVSTASKR